MTVLSRPLGVQLLAEIWECDKQALDDVQRLEKIMIDAAVAANAEVREVVFHKFHPMGVSGVVVVSESHLTIHTWPELGYAAVDIFTCGEHVDPWEALEHLANELNAEEAHAMEINRGMKNLRRSTNKPQDE